MRKVHFIGGRDGRALCGIVTDDLTGTQNRVSCARCRRIFLGEETWAQKHARELPRRPSNKALDALMHRAFKDYEGGLAVRIAALKLALQGWESADRDDLASAGEGVRTEAQALIDYLEGK